MILDKLKDRYNVIILVFSLIITVIILRLASLMIVKGEEYSEEAENRIFKNIPLSAPRGEIRDRYGRLIAGSRPSFTVQMMKNEIIDEKINEVALNLINIFEANEDTYNDEFPIVITEDGQYAFTYDINLDTWKEQYDMVGVDSGKEAFEILKKRYGIQEEDPVEAQLELLKIPDLSVPISIRTWKYMDQYKKEDWLKSYGIEDTAMSAYEVFQQLRKKTYKIPDDYSDKEARKIIVIREQLRKSGYLQYKPVKIAQDISTRSVAQIEESIMDLPGVSVEVESIRYYPEGEAAAHLLGYVGKIAQQHEIDKFIKELNYQPSDIIGKTGLEHKFEETLKGKDGYQKVLVDSRGRLIEVLERQEPIPGDTLYLAIDLNIQKVAEQVLEDVLKTIQVGGTYETKWGKNRLVGSKGPMRNATSGSVVVQDVKTGEILALANYPAYDPNLFATGISNSDWNDLLPENERDPLAPRPLMNTALSTAIQPGSTFKMLVGLAALEQGLSPNYQILDRGYIKVGGHSFGNWLWNQSGRTAGYQNLVQAITNSNNYYFYCVANGYDYGAGRPLPMEMNIDILIDYTKRFGLNDKTGIEIDIPREMSGGVPSVQRKLATIKAMLKNYLKRQLTLKDLDPEIVKPTKENLEHIIDQIVSWAEENPSRNVIEKKMQELGVAKEKSGILTDVVKYSYFNQAKWSIADTMNFSIGQGEHAYTPIQMANFMTILANGGYRYNVSVVKKTKSIADSEIVEYPPELIERVPLKNYNNLDVIAKGMYEVAASGTARSYFNKFPIPVAVKTGTAERSGKIPPIDEVEYLKSHLGRFGVSEQQVEEKTLELMEANKENSKYRDKGYAMREAIKQLNPKIKDTDLDQFKSNYDHYAWFTGFAPYDDPQIAISVLLIQGGSGGYGAPIFREIVAEYMGLNEVESNEDLVIESRLTR